MSKRRSSQGKRTSDVTRYRSLLEARLRELDSGGSREVLELGSDKADNERDKLAFEATGRAEEIGSKARRAVLAAFQRLETGKFGICQECGEPIAPGRLEARPEAAYCRECQEAYDSSAAEREQAIA